MTLDDYDVRAELTTAPRAGIMRFTFPESDQSRIQVDFSRRINVSVNARRLTSRAGSVQPDPRVLLEDVRTRGDRQHPFWAKVE